MGGRGERLRLEAMGTSALRKVTIALEMIYLRGSKNSKVHAYDEIACLVRSGWLYGYGDLRC